MDDIRSLIPCHKSDGGRAKAAVAAGYPAVDAILPELLQWLQDCNWPVSHVLIPFLESVGALLIPHVRDILNTDDDVWKYWIIHTILKESREVAEAFREELQRLAYAPTSRESHEGLNEVAQEALEEHGWQRADSMQGEDKM